MDIQYTKRKKHPKITKWEDFTEEDKTILSSIKNIITSYIGECKVTVFGSKIKGDWHENSDYDIAIYNTLDQETKIKLIKHEYGIKVDFKFISSSYPENIRFKEITIQNN
jgi:predicted nucleotidyltransferase